MIFYEEDDYLGGLVAYVNLPREEWLKQYFELYKGTLLWPPGLPPTRWPCMTEGSLRKKFHETYWSALLDYDYETDNVNQTLTLKSLWSEHPSIK